MDRWEIPNWKNSNGGKGEGEEGAGVSERKKEWEKVWEKREASGTSDIREKNKNMKDGFQENLTEKEWRYKRWNWELDKVDKEWKSDRVGF